VAVKSDGATKKQHIDADIVAGFRHQPQAVKAGDMLFLSGLMAIDKEGLRAEAKTDPRQPWHGSSAEAQAEIIIDHASRLCEAAGTSITNAVRIQQLHTDMAEFYPVYKVWERQLDGAAVPFSAVEIPSPLPVPHATLLMDIWVYCP
jgi:enamine deaminase RidA (YjgF/YER057c/UK114 family)